MSYLVKQLKRHEGLRLKAYKDSVGVWTIGYGKNLQELIIDIRLAEKWLREDIEVAQNELERKYPIVNTLSDPRKDALINMCFNLGIKRLSGFKKMWKAINKGDFHKASIEMLDSKWAKQVGDRAVELSEQMKTGKYYV